MLGDAPIRENFPFRFINRQCRISLRPRHAGGNFNRKASVAEGIPDTLLACSWRLEGLQWTRPLGWDSNWGMLGISRGSGNQPVVSSMGWWVSVRTGPVEPSGGSVVTELADGRHMPTLPSSSLIEHLLPWLKDLEWGTWTGEACDSSVTIPHSCLMAWNTDRCKDHTFHDIWIGHRPVHSTSRECDEPAMLYPLADT